MNPKMLIAASLCYFFSLNCPAVDLLEPQLTESSGLAFSNRQEHRVWTHNDSGDSARLFAFDSQTGRRTGGCVLDGVEAVDWEAMAAYDDAAGRAKLIIADCGDNEAKRDHILMHLIDEPLPDEDTALSARSRVTLRLRRPGGAVDCEAIAVDADRKRLILISKGRLPIARVEAIELSAFETPQQDGTTKLIATLPLPMITGMDIDPSNGDIWLASYFGLIRFPRTDHTPDLFSQFRGDPIVVEAPRVKQLEAIACDGKGGVWVTSEGQAVLEKVSLGR